MSLSAVLQPGGLEGVLDRLSAPERADLQRLLSKALGDDGEPLAAV